MTERLWKAEGYSEDDIRALLKKPDLTLEELEVAIYEAGMWDHIHLFNYSLSEHLTITQRGNVGCKLATNGHCWESNPRHCH